MFEWDSKKAAGNLLKHRVAFPDATAVFYDDMAITIVDPEAHEERFVTLGADPLNRILVVVYTWRGDRIRLISARRANRSERRQYQGEL
jgi:uncharacterized DUF497 family protein